MTAHLASARYSQLSTRDLDEALTLVQRLYGDVRVDVGACFGWSAKIASLGPTTLIQDTCETSAKIKGALAAHVLVLSRGHMGQVEVRGSRAEIAPGRGGALVSIGEEIEYRAERGFHALTMRVESSFLESYLSTLTGEVIQGPLVFAPALRTGAGLGAFVERLCHFLAEEVNRGTPLEHPVLLAGLQDSFARALLTSQPHSHTYLLEQPAPPSSRSVVRRVEEYLDAHLAEAISASDLPTIAGASLASIEAAFREQRGTTPAAFLRARRLEHARRALLGEPQLSLARVAHACGFLRVETFSAAYFKAFGERPEDTRRGALLGSTLPSPAALHREALDARLASLTPREREVCALVARGMLSKQIAATLGISERTVGEHRMRSMKKLGVGSAAELATALALDARTPPS